MKRKIITAILLASAVMPAAAQRVLTLDSCRAMAMNNNKPLNISKLKKEIALNTRKAARTKYLPKVNALGSYQYFSREISLLSSNQKTELSNMGSTMATAGTQSLSGIGQNITSGFSDILTGLAQQGAISPQMAQSLGQQIGSKLSEMGTNIGTAMGQQIAQAGNEVGQKIVDAFDTNTHNIWAGTVMVSQPIFMGGAITAVNRIADITERMANDDVDMKQQSTLYNIDQAYWLVVSLKQKQKLATSYRDLVKKLDQDVHKMIKQGVATKAQGLRVDVKVNEADMAVTQVEDGLTLSKMLLCQLCGLPMNENIQLADEDNADVELIDESFGYAADEEMNNRPELRLLQNTRDISEQSVKLIRAEYLPHVALTGGYMISNPNVFNGFRNKFGGTWNIGVTVQIPVWNWMEGTYKIRATKAAANIAEMELNDTREKIQLQVAQSRFKVSEAQKKLEMAENNIKSAEENLRCANLGFKEGVMEIADVMAAQTAWQQAQSQKIDAQIDVKLSQVGLNKALGILR